MQEFWEHQIEAAEDRQKALAGTIEKMGKEAVELEKVIFPYASNIKYLFS